MLPAQVAIGALPGVAQHLAFQTALKMPPQARLLHRGVPGCQVNRERIGGRYGFHHNAAAGKSARGVRGGRAWFSSIMTTSGIL